jgi:hypothetical protein
LKKILAEGPIFMSDYEQEREHDLFWGQATPADACREYAANAGADQPDRPWILTDFDVWMPNPHFVGDRGPHPED